MTNYCDIKTKMFDGIKAVFFDLDNTLFTTIPDRLAFIERECISRGAKWSSEVLEDYLKRERAVGRECDRKGINGDAKLYERGKALSAATEGCISADTGKQLVIDSLMSSLNLIPGSRDMLEYVKDLGLKTALASNGYEHIQKKRLEATDLLKYFDYFFVSDPFGYIKPDPEFYHHALEIVGCDASNALMVGDDVKRDIIGAKAAGLRTCFVSELSKHPAPAEADYIIKNFHDALQGARDVR